MSEIRKLSESIEVLDQHATSLMQRFADLSGENKKWTAASRMLSGTGLWSLQNRIRAIGAWLEIYYNAQSKKMKQDLEYAESLAKLAEIQEGLNKQEEAAKRIQDSKIVKTLAHLELKKKELKKLEDELEKKKELNVEDTERMRLLKMEVSALSQTTKQYQQMHSVIKDAVELNKKKGKGLLTDAEIEKKASDMVLKQYSFTLAKMNAMKIAQTKIMAWKLRREEKKELKQKERDKLASLAKEAWDARKVGLSDDDATGGVGAGIFKSDEVRALRKQMMSMVSSSAFGQILTLGLAKQKILGGEEGETRRPTIEALKRFRTWAKGEEGYRKKLESIWKGAKKVLAFAGSYMMYFLLFIMGAFVVFSFIREIFKNAEVMNTVMTAMKEIFGAVFLVLSGFFDIFQAFFGGGTFGERLGTLLSGFMKIFGGLGAIIFSVGKGILKLAVGLAIGIITTYIKIIVGLFSKETWLGIWDKLKEKVFSKFGEWVANFDIMGKFRSFFAGLINKMLGPINKMLGWFGAGPIPMMAKGGIAKGGLTLVGERGPELVNLPKGAMVHSNAESRRMSGNTINVNVSGRVGASDSELRDIAKKIGRMVNTEINRTTSSSTNVRF